MPVHGISVHPVWTKLQQQQRRQKGADDNSTEPETPDSKKKKLVDARAISGKRNSTSDAGAKNHKLFLKA